MKSRAPALLAIDAGTGGGKCAIFDARGQRLAIHRKAWEYEVDSNPDFPFVRSFRFDPDKFWDILCECMRAAIAEAGIAAEDIAGVAATSQREGCVFLDESGREVYAGPNLDARGFGEGMEVLDRLGAERLYAITGHSAPFIFPLARLLWHRKHSTRPVARLLMINDWMTFRLCGVAVSEASNATESMLFDLRAREWSRDICETFDIRPSILAPIRTPGEMVGAVAAAVAAATGLRPGTPVFVGGADTQCALLGAGVIEPGAAGAPLGTTTPVQMVFDRPTFDPASNLWAGCHVLSSRWVLESNAGDTGDAYLWLLDLIGGGRREAALFEFAEQAARGTESPEAYCFLGPAVFNMAKLRPDKAGGMIFPFPIMHNRPDRGDFIRSFLDSIGYAIRGNCEQLEAAAGIPPARLALSGGLSRSRALVRRIANIATIPVCVGREPDSASLGCAILAAVGAGVHADVEAAAREMVRVDEVPVDRSARERYEALYAKWRDLYDRLENLSV